MSGISDQYDNLVKLSHVEERNLTPTLLSKANKYQKLLQFNEAWNQNTRASQKQICDEIGVSVSTMNRLRKDLGVTSPYRYTVSTKSEAQKEKEKYKRIVYTAVKDGKIDEDAKTDLFDRINKSLNKDVKEEVLKLKQGTGTAATSTRRHVQTSRPKKPEMRGGTLEELNNQAPDVDYIPPRPSMDELLKKAHQKLVS